MALLAEMRMYHHSFAQAAEMLHRTLKDAESDRALLVQTLILLLFAGINTGEYDRSLRNASQAVTLTDEPEPAGPEQSGVRYVGNGQLYVWEQGVDHAQAAARARTGGSLC